MDGGRNAQVNSAAGHGGGAQSRILPDFLLSVNLKYVKLGYHHLISHLLTLCFIPLTAVTLIEISQMNHTDLRLLWLHLQYNLISVIVFSTIVVFGSTVYITTRPRSIYLVDYACYRAPDKLAAPAAQIMEHSRLTGIFDESSLEFQRKILERSGLGDETTLPKAMHFLPPKPSMAAARDEAEKVMFGALDALFCNTSVKPKDIGILVVNCSLFNPTPSLSAMIVNKYKLRGNIRSFNLGGMGCSAGVLSVDLAKDLLQIHRNTYAVVVSTENITQNCYYGNKKSMLIPNCLFRVGGSAVLLSNKSVDRSRAKYKLVHVVRTHKGADDKAFRCVYQEQDNVGKTGVSLSKDLMAIAGGALKTNITTLAKTHPNALQTHPHFFLSLYNHTLSLSLAMAATAALTMSRLISISSPKPLSLPTTTASLLSSPSSFSLKLRRRRYASTPLKFSTTTATPVRVSATISVGSTLPNSTLSYFPPSSDDLQTVTIADLTKSKKAILFAVPGAFTPTCSQKHLPGFVEKAAELKAKGVDTIACISVNDAFVMKAWKKDLGIGDEVMLLSDGNGDFTKAIGCELDLSDKPIGLGVRSRRYAMLVDDGVVKVLNLEEGGAFTFSGAEDMLNAV